MSSDRVAVFVYDDQAAPRSLRGFAAASDAEFIVTMPAGGDVFPAAIETLASALDGAPAAAIAQSFWFEADESGRVERESHRARRALMLERFTSGNDLRGEIRRHGDILSPLRMYRRAALEAAFQGAADIESMLRNLLSSAELVTVREYLFCRRNRAGRRHRRTDGWANLRKAPIRFYRRRLVPLVERLYYAIVEKLGPHADRVLPRQRKHSGPQRIAYFMWRFPVLSQTFVNRELAALVASGTEVEVIAEGAEDLELSDHNAQALRSRTMYVGTELAAKDRSELRRAHPLAYFRVHLFAILCRYTRQKQWHGDRLEFERALRLALLLRRRGITRVHAPWSDRTALVALMAARLVGIPFSAQVRAHDLHRRSYQSGLMQRLRPASFIITNTRYNESHLRDLLGQSPPVHVIHNGIDLDRFRPDGAGRDGTRILCVARLIEQKGLTHLLEACALLARRGVVFHCDVIGAPEEPLYTNYFIALKKLHRRLGLGELVRFAGALPLREVIDAYAGAAVFTLPAVIAADGSRDIIPNAVLEAMAMRLPVVATTVGGLPEMIEHGVSGVLVPPGDAIALADALEALLADPARRASLGASARRRIEEKFDISRNVEAYARLFA